MDVQITNGLIKYGETRKIADFENKRADVELSFNVPDGQDAQKIMDQVQSMARGHCFAMISGTPVGPFPKPEHLVSAALQLPPGEQPKTVKVHNRRAPKMPEPVAENTPPVLRTEAVIDPAALEEPKFGTAPAMAAVAEQVVENTEKLLAVGPAAITDAELMDATTKCQQAVKNAPAIRKLLNESGVKAPPGRIIDLPQEKRQAYLDGLKLIKPLA